MQDSRGFKCTFDRGCLSLWFNFRRDVSGLTPVSFLVVDQFVHSIIANNHAKLVHWITLLATFYLRENVLRLFLRRGTVQFLVLRFIFHPRSDFPLYNQSK